MTFAFEDVALRWKRMDDVTQQRLSVKRKWTVGSVVKAEDWSVVVVDTSHFHF